MTEDLWDYHSEGSWVVIPTNQQVKKGNLAVMGAGLALQAANRFPDLPTRYGRALMADHPFMAYKDLRLLMVPTKVSWREPSDMQLIGEAADRIRDWCRNHPDEHVVIPALGCGHGELDWDMVRLVLEEVVVEGCNVTILDPL